MKKAPAGCIAYNISVGGLSGGHSGDEIHKGRGNANKILNRLLWNSSNQYHLRLSRFEGGNLRNAIPREASATVVIPESESKSFLKYVKAYAAATDNVGLFFGEDIFFAIGSIVLIQQILMTYGYNLAPLQLALWAIPSAIAAFLIHSTRLLILDRKLGRRGQ